LDTTNKPEPGAQLAAERSMARKPNIASPARHRPEGGAGVALEPLAGGAGVLVEVLAPVAAGRAVSAGRLVSGAGKAGAVELSSLIRASVKSFSPLV
jgi:hypothetical protein